MDMIRLAVLETQITQLLQAYSQVKAENTRLLHHLTQCQQTLLPQQPHAEGWSSALEELLHLRTAAQAWQHERDIIRARLVEMQAALERLEGLAQTQETTVRTPRMPQDEL